LRLEEGEEEGIMLNVRRGRPAVAVLAALAALAAALATLTMSPPAGAVVPCSATSPPAPPGGVSMQREADVAEEAGAVRDRLVVGIGAGGSMWTLRLTNCVWGAWTNQGGSLLTGNFIVVQSRWGEFNFPSQSYREFPGTVGGMAADGSLWARDFSASTLGNWYQVAGPDAVPFIIQQYSSTFSANGWRALLKRRANGSTSFIWRPNATGPISSWVDLGGAFTSVPNMYDNQAYGIAFSLWGRGADGSIWWRDVTTDGTVRPWRTTGGVVKEGQTSRSAASTFTAIAPDSSVWIYDFRGSGSWLGLGGVATFELGFDGCSVSVLGADLQAWSRSVVYNSFGPWRPGMTSDSC
jgi:hypothetical protein